MALEHYEEWCAVTPQARESLSGEWGCCLVSPPKACGLTPFPEQLPLPSPWPPAAEPLPPVLQLSFSAQASGPGLGQMM